jgi:hypothetical protein
MNRQERERQRQQPDDKGIGNEVPSRNRSSEEDAKRQSEGNLGNERNRTDSGSERRPDTTRDTDI